VEVLVFRKEKTEAKPLKYYRPRKKKEEMKQQKIRLYPSKYKNSTHKNSTSQAHTDQNKTTAKSYFEGIRPYSNIPKPLGKRNGDATSFPRKWIKSKLFINIYSNFRILILDLLNYQK
jgi:hypothetical protein